jgi:hypothetical protein
LAIVTDEAQVLVKRVIPLELLKETVAAFEREFGLTMIIVGDRTNSKYIRECLTSFKKPIKAVDENNSTIEGRYRYLRENTKGLTRLIPIGLRIPKEPFDDYVAVIIAERFLKNNPIITGGK